MTMTPEHWHLALNHLPILGMPFGALVLAWGLLRRQSEITRLGLVIVLIAAAATPWIMSTGEEAQMNYEGADFVDSEGYAWMTEHAERAVVAARAAYATGILALLALVASIRNPKTFRVLALIALLAALATAGFAVRTADAGGKIRRPDFRAPADTSDTL